MAKAGTKEQKIKYSLNLEFKTDSGLDLKLQRLIYNRWVSFFCCLLLLKESIAYPDVNGIIIESRNVEKCRKESI